jgi:hypothetical protein
MIIEITFDSAPFLLVLVVLILAFSVGFYMLFASANHDALMYESGETTDPYLGFQSVLTVFKMLLGDIDTDIFAYSSSPGLAMLLFVIFMVAMVIINMVRGERGRQLFCVLFDSCFCETLLSHAMCRMPPLSAEPAHRSHGAYLRARAGGRDGPVLFGARAGHR